MSVEKNYMTCGPSPVNEDCVQFGSDNYTARAQAECERYAALLAEKFPDAAARSCAFGVRAFRHDFGVYYEVVICYDRHSIASCAFADDVSANLPETWEG